MKKEHKNQGISRLLKALGEPRRLDILCLLRDRVLCVGAIARRLDITQSAVSQHLRILKDSGLVISERRGYHVHYRINEQAFSEIATFVKGFQCKKQKKCTASTCKKS